MGSKHQIDMHLNVHFNARFASCALECPNFVWIKKKIQTRFLKVEIYNVFYADRNLHGWIFNRLILDPLLWKYHEASSHSDTYM